MLRARDSRAEWPSLSLSLLALRGIKLAEVCARVRSDKANAQKINVLANKATLCPVERLQLRAMQI